MTTKEKYKIYQKEKLKGKILATLLTYEAFEYREFKSLFTNNESDQFILDEYKRLKENMQSVPEINCVVSYKKMLDSYRTSY